MSDRDEYRFHPDDFDDDGNRVDTETDPAPIVIIGCFGMGLGFLATSFFVDSFGIFGTDISPVGAATVMFALGLLAGGGSYIQQGRFRLGVVHLGGALGWVFIVLGRYLSSSIALIIGSLLLIAGAVALSLLIWHSNA